MPLQFHTHEFARRVKASPNTHTCMLLVDLINGDTVFGGVTCLDVTYWVCDQFLDADRCTQASSAGRVFHFELASRRAARRVAMADRLLARPDEVVTIQPDVVPTGPDTSP